MPYAVVVYNRYEDEDCYMDLRVLRRKGYIRASMHPQSTAIQYENNATQCPNFQQVDVGDRL